jgi:hypothetical protein
MTLIPLAIGSKIVYTARFVPAKLMQLIREHRPDIFMAIPSMWAAEVRRLKQLEDEVRRLKQLVADLSLDKAMLQDVLRKKL